MRHSHSTLPLVLSFTVALAFSARAQQVPIVEKTLGNGMRLLLVERHDEPSVAGGWVAHVGSSNEKPGITGIAHLFEHMMFKGTKTIGTKDYAQDLEIINEQERVRELMRAEEVKLRAMWRRGEIDDWQKPENKRRAGRSWKRNSTSSWNGSEKSKSRTSSTKSIPPMARRA
ncbi:MAG: insulinase family protein [Verrucomicrobiota bacterium]